MKVEATESSSIPGEGKVLQARQNGVTQPKAGGITARIWTIADEQSQALGAPARRKEVMAQSASEGYNLATSASQYGRWRKYHGLTGRGT